MKYLKLYESFKERTFQDYINSKIAHTDARIEQIAMNNLYKAPVINCEKQKLTSLDGIEKLKFIQELYCGENHLTSLKGLENLNNLKKLYCYTNKLTNLEEIRNLPSLRFVNCMYNPLEYPMKLKDCAFLYNQKQIAYFKTYECQKNFLTKFPERANELESFGYHEDIIKEFSSIIRGAKWGFFDLERSSK